MASVETEEKKESPGVLEDRRATRKNREGGVISIYLIEEQAYVAINCTPVLEVEVVYLYRMDRRFIRLWSSLFEHMK